MALLCTYVGAKSCTSGPQPGAKALMSWYLGAYGPLGGVNSGIYLCRDIAGTGILSLHAEGRACDLGVRPYSARYGTTLAEALRKNSRELGVQCIIWNRRIWSGSYCQQGWRTYGGTNPHIDHLHVELSWWAAANLTVSLIQTTLSGGGSGATTMSILGLRKGDTGERVELLQTLGKQSGFGEYLGAAGVDGVYGDGTAAMVLAMRKSVGSSATSGDKVTQDAAEQIARVHAMYWGRRAVADEIEARVAVEVARAVAELPALGLVPHHHDGGPTGPAIPD